MFTLQSQGLVLRDAQFRKQLGAFFLCSSKEFLDWFKSFSRKGGGASAANFFPSRRICLWYGRFWHMGWRKVRRQICLRRTRRMKGLPIRNSGSRDARSNSRTLRADVKPKWTSADG